MPPGPTGTGKSSRRAQAGMGSTHLAPLSETIGSNGSLSGTKRVPRMTRVVRGEPEEEVSIRMQSRCASLGGKVNEFSM
jgi:hypothetical protein